MARGNQLKYYDSKVSDFYNDNGKYAKKWNGLTTISFYSRGESGKLIKKKIHLAHIYKLGHDYKEVYFKNGKFNKFDFSGYIIDVYGRVYDGIRYNTFNKIHNICYKNGTTKMTKYNMIYKKSDYRDIIVFVKATEYFCKFTQTDKFVTLCNRIHKDIHKRKYVRNIPSDVYNEEELDENNIDINEENLNEDDDSQTNELEYEKS